MKIKIALIIALCFISKNLIGQFVVTISTSKVNNCKDTIITFTAAATNGGIPVNNATFTWSFGDGKSPVSGFMLDTVTNSFTTRRGYIVRVDASSGVNKDYALLKIQIGLKPDFTGINSSREDNLCLGEQILLTGVYNTDKWEYNVPDTVVEANPFMVSNTSQFKADFDYRIFTKGQNVTNASNISSIGLNMEHSNTSNLKIELKCPNGTSVILKNYGGPDKYFGVPVDNETSNLAGTGYQYTWTNSPTNGSMNSLNPATTFPAGSYTPEQPFSNLIGCPLNGDWQIIVTDNLDLDNGFVFSAQMLFNPSILPAKWEYSNTYTTPLWTGNGVSSTSGTGLATAIPVAYGLNRYTFNVKDNFNCTQDTFVNSHVEAVTFTANPTTSDINKPISFTNTTSWATTYKWNFGDGSNKETIENPSHTYTKDGNFWAILTAGASDGCTDKDSVMMVITVPTLVDFEMPNVFTPNGDNSNEIYKPKGSSLDGIESLDCYIYSRWGKKVVEWHSVEEAMAGWDGNIKGGPKASSGVYYYYIKIVGYNGQKLEKKGAFELFR
jgi:gliding motility-associated-like protein